MFRGLAQFDGEAVNAVLDLDQIRERIECGLQAGAIRVFFEARKILLQVADTDPSGNRDLPRVRCKGAGQHAEEARLSGAVLADKRDPIPRIDGQGDVFEYLFVRERERNVSELGEHEKILCLRGETEALLQRSSLHAAQYIPAPPGGLDPLKPEDVYVARGVCRPPNPYTRGREAQR